MAKGRLTHAVLAKLVEFGEGTLDAFFPRNYSYTRIWRPLLGLEPKRKITRHMISLILWRLQREGLVERTGGMARKSVWSLTKKGRQYHTEIRHPALSEPLIKDGITRLVIFDIPERERKKRDILRTELVGCGFRQLQKSVWVGEHRLPRDFITLLDDLKIGVHVHIFSIREKGTTQNVV